MDLRLIMLVSMALLQGCSTTGNSLVQDIERPEYEVFSFGEHGYLVRYNGGGSRAKQLEKWHDKARELCNGGAYEGSPAIQTITGGTTDVPVYIPGNAIYGTGWSSIPNDEDVAAGRVTCS